MDGEWMEGSLAMDVDGCMHGGEERIAVIELRA